MDIRDITKLPNILTVLRILLIPVFVIVFLWGNGNIELDIGRFNKENGYIIAAAIMILSGLTDMADGLIARKLNMITDLGKVIDPFADKLTQAAVVVCLIFRYSDIWVLIAALLVLIVIKEILMLIMGVMFLRKGQDLGGARWYGKLATIIFYFQVIVLIGAPVLSDIAAAVMFCIMIAFTLLSFIMYMREYYRLKKQRGPNEKGE
ncbi:MAG: CDP-alcohol phosphatidyltransferase family protein [Oscillospiraceae bacterium]|nr:CDP-alcohol phosphatidyltransferase family protein [Oscillospiraceae bacterium]